MLTPGTAHRWGERKQGSREKKQNPSSAGNAHESQRCAAQGCGRGYGGVGGRRLEPGSGAGEILFCFQGPFCFGCAEFVRPSF